MVKLSSVSYRACIVACLMGVFMASTAGAVTPHGAATSSQAAKHLASQQFNISITKRGRPLLISSVMVSKAGAADEASWKEISYVRSCTTNNGVASRTPGTVRIGIRFGIRRDLQRAGAFVVTVLRRTLIGMHTVTSVNGCKVTFPTVASRTASFIVPAQGGSRDVSGAGGFRVVVTRI